MDYAVDILGWNEIIHCIEAENAPSIRVAERLGSAKLRVSPAPPPFKDVVWEIYGQSADDWRARRAHEIRRRANPVPGLFLVQS